MKKLFFGLESDKPSNNIETEIAVYAKIGDLTKLEEADRKQEIVQYDSMLKTGIKTRVRYTSDKNGDSYVFTYKLKHKDDDVRQYTEVSTKVDKAFFDNFKYAAECKFIKTRYLFIADNVKLKFKVEDEIQSIVLNKVMYEVDVFKNIDGVENDWCKIEVELDSLIGQIEKQYPSIKNINLILNVSHLPFKPSRCLLESEANNKEAIDVLWEEFKLDPLK